MGILDSIIQWLAEQFTSGMDLISTSVLDALGTDLTLFARYFPGAETMYTVFMAMGIALVILGVAFQLLRNFGVIAGLKAEEPTKLAFRGGLFLFLVWNSGAITRMALRLVTPAYQWILDTELEEIQFASFLEVFGTALGAVSSPTVSVIVLVLAVVLAWNYLKLLVEAAERYIVVGVLVYTAPLAIACGSTESTANVFNSWCRMLAGQLLLLILNAWCLRLFAGMVGILMASPMSP